MNKKEIFKKVAGIIAELNEQYEYLSQSPENLNELELELFAANADFLSDHISILQKLNKNSNSISPSQENQSNSKAGSITSVFEMPLEENIKNEEVPEASINNWKLELDEEPLVAFDFEKRDTDKLFDRPLTEEEKEVINSKTKIKEVIEEEHGIIEEKPVSEDFANSSINQTSEAEPEKSDELKVSLEKPLFEPVVEVKRQTINDILSSQNAKNTVSGQFVNRPVKDLKSLISLNDKLLFVRDLFNGYSLAYSEALELLNRFESFEAADNFLRQNYSTKNNWAEKQNVADKFYEILNNRYLK